MANSRRRFWASALILVCSIAGTEAQQQRSSGPDRSRVERVAAAGGVIGSVDSDGVPKFVWAARARPAPSDATPDVAARWHLRQFARALDVSAADVDATVTRGVHALSSGDVIVELRQQVAGLDVLGSDVKVLMRADHQLVAFSGRPRATTDARLGFDRSREEALAAALSDRLGMAVSPSSVDTVTTGGERPTRANHSRA